MFYIELQMFSDVFKCSQDALNCSETFSDVFIDVLRCFQMLTDVHRCSLDVLWMFSRCFLDVFLGGSQDFSMMFLECSH